jgi:hypothetical protein
MAASSKPLDSSQLTLSAVQISTSIQTEKKAFYALQGRVSWGGVSLFVGVLALVFTSRIASLATRAPEKFLDLAKNYLTTKNITLAGRTLLGFGFMLMKWEARQTNKAADKAFDAINATLQTDGKSTASAQDGKGTSILALLGLNNDASLKTIEAGVLKLVNDGKVRSTLVKETGLDGEVSDQQIVEFVRGLKTKNEGLVKLKRDVIGELRESAGSTLPASDIKDEQIVGDVKDLAAKHKAVVEALTEGLSPAPDRATFDAAKQVVSLRADMKMLGDFKTRVLSAIKDSSVTAQSTAEQVAGAITKVVTENGTLREFRTQVVSKLGLQGNVTVQLATQEIQSLQQRPSGAGAVVARKEKSGISGFLSGLLSDQ